MKSVLLTLAANTASFEASMRKAANSVHSIQSALNLIKPASLIYLGQQALNTGAEIYNFTKSIASAANDIERNARTVNMTTEQYQKWTYAAKMADVSTEDFIASFRFLTKAISDANQGTGDASSAFKLMGVEIKDASGKTKDQQTILLQTIDALNKFADGANRDALMMAIFGRSFLTMKPLVNEGTEALRDYMREAEKYGFIVENGVIKQGSEAEKQFKKIDLQVQAIKASMVPLASSMAQFFLDLVKDARNALSELEKIGNWFGGILERSRKATEDWKNKRGYPSSDQSERLGIKVPKALTAEELYNIGGPEYTFKPKEEAPVMKKSMEDEELNKRILQLRKQMLSVGYQTTEMKTAELELDKQTAIVELSKFGNTQKLKDLTNELYEARKKELVVQEKMADNLRIYTAQFADFIRSTENWNIDEQIVKLTGSFKAIETEEDAILAAEYAIGKLTDEQYDKRRKLLDIIQLQRKAEEELGPSEYGKGSQAFYKYGYEMPPKTQPEVAEKMKELQILNQVYNLQGQYFQLASGGTQQLIGNMRMLRDNELERLQLLQAAEPLYADFYEKQIEWINKVYAAQEELMVNGFKRYAVEIGDITKQIAEAEYNWARGMENVYTGFFTSMFDTTKSWKDKLTDLFKGIADTFIQEVARMIAKWLVFQSLPDTKGTGGAGNWLGVALKVVGGIAGIAGGVGGAVSSGYSMAESSAWSTSGLSINAYQHGGIAKKPQIAKIAEAGPEAIIPLKNGAIPVEFKALRSIAESADQEKSNLVKGTVSLKDTTIPVEFKGLDAKNISAKSIKEVAIPDKVIKNEKFNEKSVSKLVEVIRSISQKESISKQEFPSIKAFGDGGIIPGSFIPIKAFAAGGVTNVPTLGLIGEKRQPEAIIPLQGGGVPVQFMNKQGQERTGGEGRFTAYYIQAMDPIAWRDFVRRNPQPIIEQMAKSSRTAGDARKMIKNVD